MAIERLAGNTFAEVTWQVKEFMRFLAERQSCLVTGQEISDAGFGVSAAKDSLVYKTRQAYKQFNPKYQHRLLASNGSPFLAYLLISESKIEDARKRGSELIFPFREKLETAGFGELTQTACDRFIAEFGVDPDSILNFKVDPDKNRLERNLTQNSLRLLLMFVGYPHMQINRDDIVVRLADGFASVDYPYTNVSRLNQSLKTHDLRIKFDRDTSNYHLDRL
jgi:hypothetical protein